MSPQTVVFQRVIIRAIKQTLSAWTDWLDSIDNKPSVTGPPAAPITHGDSRTHDAALDATRKRDV